jgi:DNA-binding transcriptional ArsR family regulator
MQDKALANLMSAIANPRRVAILRLLLNTKEPLTMTFIAAHLGIQDGPTSHNLQRLVDVGLISRSPSGKYAFFQVNRSVMRDIIRFWRTKPVPIIGDEND